MSHTHTYTPAITIAWIAGVDVLKKKASLGRADLKPLL